MAAKPPPGPEVNLTNPPSIGYQLVISSIVCVSISTMFLAMRLYTRKVLLNVIGWDDFWITLAWVRLSLSLSINSKSG